MKLCQYDLFTRGFARQHKALALVTKPFKVPPPVHDYRMWPPRSASTPLCTPPSRSCSASGPPSCRSCSGQPSRASLWNCRRRWGHQGIEAAVSSFLHLTSGYDYGLFALHCFVLPCPMCNHVIQPGQVHTKTAVTQVSAALEAFSAEYHKLKAPRKLQWKPFLGSVQLVVSAGGVQRELRVAPMQVHRRLLLNVVLVLLHGTFLFSIYCPVDRIAFDTTYPAEQCHAELKCTVTSTRFRPLLAGSGPAALQREAGMAAGAVGCCHEAQPGGVAQDSHLLDVTG